MPIEIYTLRKCKEKDVLYDNLEKQTTYTLDFITNTLLRCSANPIQKINRESIVDAIITESINGSPIAQIDKNFFSTKDVILMGLNEKLVNTKKFLEKETEMLNEVNLLKQKFKAEMECLTNLNSEYLGLESNNLLILKEDIEKKLIKAEKELFNRYFMYKKYQLIVLFSQNGCWREKFNSYLDFKQYIFETFKYESFESINKNINNIYKSKNIDDKIDFYAEIIECLGKNIEKIIEIFNHNMECQKEENVEDFLIQPMSELLKKKNEKGLESVLSDKDFNSYLNKLCLLCCATDCMPQSADAMRCLEDISYDIVYKNICKDFFLISKDKDSNDINLAKTIGFENIEEFTKVGLELEKFISEKLDDLFIVFNLMTANL